MELAVIGSSDFILGFKLAGVKKTLESGRDDLAEKVVSLLSDRSIGVLVMHNDDFEKLPNNIRDMLDDSVEPTVVKIGGKGESSSLREKIKQSIGVDLWK